ncbi:uncharacterized protein BXZ73DRAFT_100000 [Epithele typhae]|uniref:uncharacterized protein n=1 Tax=Epithele typhae TaxID=378194 RepID=UPI0020076871|nr:uncharacterized protein BXZ73DRAFT_100000 [Epithele typhae]KAH9937779.1 hypothetical protein BXZ73DRAFT_100000 [Epithele typhae]
MSLSSPGTEALASLTLRHPHRHKGRARARRTEPYPPSTVVTDGSREASDTQCDLHAINGNPPTFDLGLGDQTCKYAQ